MNFPQPLVPSSYMRGSGCKYAACSCTRIMTDLSRKAQHFPDILLLHGRLPAPISHSSKSLSMSFAKDSQLSHSARGVFGCPAHGNQPLEQPRGDQMEHGRQGREERAAPRLGHCQPCFLSVTRCPCVWASIHLEKRLTATHRH